MKLCYDLLLVLDGEGRCDEDGLQAGVPSEGLREGLQGLGDGFEGLRLGCGRVLPSIVLDMSSSHNTTLSRYSEAYQSAGVSTIDAEQLDRRLGAGICRLCRGFSEGACSSELESRSCHSERPSCDAAGQHGERMCGGVVERAQCWIVRPETFRSVVMASEALRQFPRGIGAMLDLTLTFTLPTISNSMAFGLWERLFHLFRLMRTTRFPGRSLKTDRADSSHVPTTQNFGVHAGQGRDERNETLAEQT